MLGERRPKDDLGHYESYGHQENGPECQQIPLAGSKDLSGVHCLAIATQKHGLVHALRPLVASHKEGTC